LIVRTGNGEVIIDLDGDGQEQTGWDLLYLHVAARDRVPAGKWVNVDDLIGHPSCEGGAATGTHVHLARKYNGEWIDADGPIPFVLSGWQAQASDRQYSGGLSKNGQMVTSRIDGVRTSIIKR
jgi:LasA protease